MPRQISQPQAPSLQIFARMTVLESTQQTWFNTVHVHLEKVLNLLSSTKS